jgi:hypothetical protein
VEPAPKDTVVVPVREDAPIRIYCFIEDLFFLAKIQEAARKVGVKVAFVKADKDIVSRLADVPEGSRPSLIVFDLEQRQRQAAYADSAPQEQNEARHLSDRISLSFAGRPEGEGHGSRL